MANSGVQTQDIQPCTQVVPFQAEELGIRNVPEKLCSLSVMETWEQEKLTYDQISILPSSLFYIG